MAEGARVTPFAGRSFSKEDLIKLEPPLLRALLRERVHHNIEVPFYTMFPNWKGEPKPNFGQQALLVFEVWKERGLTHDDPDIKWAERYCSIAKRIQAGKAIDLKEPLPAAFTEEEMAVVNKLIYERRSMRNWIDKPVPDEMIKKILEAGRAAPIGCNLDEVRFIVLRGPEAKKMIWGDISTANAVVIAICYDSRIPEVVGQGKTVPQNAGFDAAAAADHMLLIGHALGLGGVWLSKTAETDLTKDTGRKFKEQYGLPDYIEVALHIAIGWPAIGTIKTQRMPLDEYVIKRGNI